MKTIALLTMFFLPGTSFSVGSIITTESLLDTDTSTGNSCASIFREREYKRHFMDMGDPDFSIYGSGFYSVPMALAKERDF